MGESEGERATFRPTCAAAGARCAAIDPGLHGSRDAVQQVAREAQDPTAHLSTVGVWRWSKGEAVSEGGE